MDKFRFAIVLWLFVWPVVTALSWLVRGLSPDLAIPLQTFVVSIVLVPVMVWFAVPTLTRLLSN